MSNPVQHRLTFSIGYLHKKQPFALHLYNQHIGDQGLKFLLSHPYQFQYWNMRMLEQLYLSNNEISWEGVQYLQPIQWDKLLQLSLYCNNMGDRGVKGLLNCHFPSLQRLNLSQNTLTDASLKFLTKAHLPSLKFLILSYNLLTTSGFHYLSLLSLPKIQQIILNDNKYVEKLGMVLVAGIAGLGMIKMLRIHNERCRAQLQIGWSSEWTPSCIVFSSAH